MKFTNIIISRCYYFYDTFETYKNGLESYSSVKFYDLNFFYKIQC